MVIARSSGQRSRDQRSIDALDVAERYANGTATKDELALARAAYAAQKQKLIEICLDCEK